MHHLDFKLDLYFRLSVYSLLKWLLYYSKQSEIKNPFRCVLWKMLASSHAEVSFLYKIEKWPKLQCHTQFNLQGGHQLINNWIIILNFANYFLRVRIIKRVAQVILGSLLTSGLWNTHYKNPQQRIIRTMFCSKRNRCSPKDNRVNISGAW